MTRNIHQTLKILRDDAELPLLTETEILEAIRQTPVAAPTEPTPESFWRRNRTSFSIGAATLATATVVGIVLMPTESETPNSTPIASRKIDSSPKIASSPQTVADSSGVEVRSRTRGRSAQSARTSAPTPGVAMIELNSDELSNLGLTYDRKHIVYSEDGHTITISTSGVAVLGSPSFDEKKPTPRHVSIYQDNGPLLSSWYDGEQPESDVNELVPIRLYLEDRNNSIFKSAEVILWYSPSDAFEIALTNTNRKVLSAPSETNTSTPSITSSSLYPNPVNGSSCSLRILVSNSCTVTGELFDINGHSVMQLWRDSHHWPGASYLSLEDLDDLSNGMYLVVVTVDGGSDRIVQRLLIER